MKNTIDQFIKKFKHVIYDIYMMGGIMNQFLQKLQESAGDQKLPQFIDAWEAIFYFD